MRYDEVDNDNVREMVLAFYARVLEDDILGPIFTRVLGPNINEGKWHEHLYRLEEFWMLLMCGIPGYRGDPTPAHAFIGGLTPESFERWLALFNEVVNELYAENVSEQFYKKALIVANQLRENLGVDDDED